MNNSGDVDFGENEVLAKKCLELVRDIAARADLPW